MEEEARTSQGAFATYGEAVGWITGLLPMGIRPGLKRMEAFMEHFDHPERQLKFIHVAGTNGKGSICAYLTNVLIKNGYDVGTFTSPYITKYSDRIQFNQQNIPDEELVRLANLIKPIADDLAETELGAPTMFEVTTVLAILYFATVAYPDFVVWETGLGGRLDSTNVVVPVVSVITNVGHDHMELLGDTLEQVAMEKAGIIKPGVPVVSAVEQPEAIRVLERVCTERKSTLYLLNRQFRFQPVSLALNEHTLDFAGPFREYRQVTIGLNGPHQLKNAATALMTLEVLRQYYAVVLEDELVWDGFRSTTWPGRLEQVSESPRILLDGAHNPEGAEALAASLQSGMYAYGKLHMMVGMLASKNHLGYFRHILPIVDTLILTEPAFRKRMAAADLAQLAQILLPKCKKVPDLIVEPDLARALSLLKERTGPEDLAVVSGSLYLISDVRALVLSQTDTEKGW